MRNAREGKFSVSIPTHWLSFELSTVFSELNLATKDTLDACPFHMGSNYILYSDPFPNLDQAWDWPSNDFSATFDL